MQTEQLKLKVSERTNFQKIQGISAYVFFQRKEFMVLCRVANTTVVHIVGVVVCM